MCLRYVDNIILHASEPIFFTTETTFLQEKPSQRNGGKNKIPWRNKTRKGKGIIFCATEYLAPFFCFSSQLCIQLKKKSCAIILRYVDMCCVQDQIPQRVQVRLDSRTVFRELSLENLVVLV